MKKDIVVICGPTGIGKTGFALELAKRFNGEIIGADSMQIYRHMDIGTAKPDREERAAAPHHLVDVADPDEEFDAARFAKMADSAVKEIDERGNLPIVAGGTGFYIKAFLHGLFRGRAADQTVINMLEHEIEIKGSSVLHARLEISDPDSAEKIHPHDSFRIVRALEVLVSTGKTISSFQKGHSFGENRYNALKIGLYMDRETLYQRIDKRVDLMISQGLINEVEQLMKMGYSCDLKPMQSIGYRHICDFLNKKVSWQETLRLFKRDTRRYAKRQFTWFKRDDDIIWLKPDETDKAVKLVHKWGAGLTPYFMKTTKNIMACMVLLLFFSLFFACAVKVPVVQQPEKPESAISVKPEESVPEKPLLSKAEQLGIKGQQSLSTGDIRAALYFYNQALAKADEKERAELIKEINSFIVKTDTSILEDLLKSESNLIPEPVILYRLGLNYASHGSYSKAEKVLVLLIDKYPDHVDSRNAMEIVQLFKEHAFKRNKIGCLLPLSGKFSVFGQKALRGVELAVSDLSKEYSQGIKVFIKDTQSDNKMAVKGMEELLIQKVAAIAGPMITAGAACTIAEENEIPIIAMTQKEEVALKGEYVFSNFLTPEMQARALVSYAFKNLGVTRFAMLYPRDRYGRKYMNLFWDMVDEIGGEIVGVESYSHDQTDFADAIKKITGAYYPLPAFLTKDKNPLSSESAAIHDFSQSSAGVLFKGDESLIDFKAVFIPDAPSKVTLILPQLAYNDATGLYLLGTNIWH
ncbi:MAG: tRNA (adenosine(37)-N6)-dimethylallyltransferase MiaA, partial [Thermodesulfobacteriota bacterium]|nr:tRNA (adenosine(37)-N6)-dimethylallyltransferase MiaA [Thermodesulfobacteriota bacterium]